MIASLTAMGFSQVDLNLLVICPLLGLLGSVVRALMIRNSLESLPGYPTAEKFSFWFVYSRANWYWGWAVAGIGAGLLVALLFVGAVADSANAIGRICAVALLSGFGAPSFWKHQEQTLSAIADARVKALVAANKTN